MTDSIPAAVWVNSMRPAVRSDRIEAEEGFVGQAGERERAWARLPAGGAQDGGQMLAEQHVVRLAAAGQDARHSSGTQHDAEHGQGPAATG